MTIKPSIKFLDNGIIVDDDKPIIKGLIKSNSIKILGSIYTGEDYHETYHGEYEVIPRAYDQTLFTENKIMEEDVEVKKIPYADVDNPFGGITITIG